MLVLGTRRSVNGVMRFFFFFCLNNSPITSQFFVNFVQAAFVFTIYTFATLLVYIIKKASATASDIDPQEIVVLALYVIFSKYISQVHAFLQSGDIYTIHGPTPSVTCAPDLDEPDDSREHAGARIARAGIEGAGKCAWVLADSVCHFSIVFRSCYLLMFCVAPGSRDACARDGTRNGVRLRRKAISGG